MKQRFWGGALVFLGACSFGVLSSIVKTAYKAGYTLGQVTGVQNLFGMLMLWILYIVYKFFRHSSLALTVKQQTTKNWQVCLAGIFPCLVAIFYYQCVQLVPASIAIILLMQYLWISVIVDYLRFRNKPSLPQIIAVVMIIGGSIFAAGIFNQNITLNIKGYIFGFLAAITYTLFIITSNRVGVDLPTLKKSALMITGACILGFIIFPPIFLLQFAWDEKLYQWGLLLALLGTVIPPFLFAIGIPKVGISVSAILTAVELPVAVLASYFYLNESVNASQWLGVLIILIAIVASNLFVAKKLK
ncbi:DMT family transporter [Frischella sp. Ac48]|uniref:DMT family transporter n=1 Tax=Frischella japonica TaxID=2741544 RepID=A0ABR7QVR7_9GAMM|nr:MULTISPECIES: DMT family transporter [Frischella]MBC9130285.1 DMT family transporter [Frischella japonica]MBX4133274.1 DMT family transporter [Frischella sp. Ac48]